MPAPDDHPRFRYCPNCAGALQARILKPGEPERLVCDVCGSIIYLDPKVAVGTIIRAGDDGIVLVRRAIDPGYGLWVFPGGYVDRGEKLEEAAIREAKEECGLDVRLERLLNVYSYRGRTPVIVVYTAGIVGGALTVADDESLEVGTFTADRIPWDALAFESTREALREYFAGRESTVWSRDSS